MGLYKKIPYVVGEDVSVLCHDRLADKIVKVRCNQPGNIIMVHGVNDVGTCYKAIEEGLCAGLGKRLSRDFTPAHYSNPKPKDKYKLEPDPDAVYFKRKTDEETNSPVIPFYWGYREIKSERKTANGQFTDRYGNRLDKDLSKGGGPFANATGTLPDMWNRGVYFPLDIGGDPVRPLKTAPGRLYMVLAAQRLAALISIIRDFDSEETVTIVAHSQGCMVSLLAQAMLMAQGLAAADTLILTHPPYSLVEDVPWEVDGLEMFQGGSDGLMEEHYEPIDGRQTLHARLQTLINIVRGVAGKRETAHKPDFAGLNDQCQHHGMVGAGWQAQVDRDNRGKVYLYFCPEDMTVALDSIQGIGWQGVPDYIDGSELRKKDEWYVDWGAAPAPEPQLQAFSVHREALRNLGKSFYQRVFTAKLRLDPRNGKTGPVRVGQEPHDFALRIKGEDEHSHVEKSGRSHRAEHKEVAWPVDEKNTLIERCEGIRKITGELLGTPVVADLRGNNQIDSKDIPKGSSHAGLAAMDRGPCEEVDQIDAATATANSSRISIEERPDPTGAKGHLREQPEELARYLKKMTALYNQEKHLGEKDPDDKRTIVRAYRLAGGKVIAHVEASPNEIRRDWQKEVSAKSFHGGIIGSARNHEQVTAYDVAIGSGKASSDPLFYSYLCAVADWRLKKPANNEKPRIGILKWNEFTEKFNVFWKVEPQWRQELINGSVDYYSHGVLPACILLLAGPLCSTVISETTNRKAGQWKSKL